jgi:hypothetical protein
MALAIPEPEWLYLHEAVALVAPPLDVNDTWNAIIRALAEDRLRERSADNLNADLTWGAFRAARQGLGHSAADWQYRLEIGVEIGRDSGTVFVPVGDRIVPLRPQLRRRDVLALFKSAPVKAASPNSATATQGVVGGGYLDADATYASATAMPSETHVPAEQSTSATVQPAPTRKAARVSQETVKKWMTGWVDGLEKAGTSPTQRKALAAATKPEVFGRKVTRQQVNDALDDLRPGLKPGPRGPRKLPSK